MALQFSPYSERWKEEGNKWRGLKTHTHLRKDTKGLCFGARLPKSAAAFGKASGAFYSVVVSSVPSSQLRARLVVLLRSGAGFLCRAPGRWAGGGSGAFQRGLCPHGRVGGTAGSVCLSSVVMQEGEITSLQCV